MSLPKNLTFLDITSRPLLASPWLVPGVFADGKTTLLFGAKGTGKTTVAFGAFVPAFLDTGGTVVVLSDETSEAALFTYATAHGYTDALDEQRLLHLSHKPLMDGNDDARRQHLLGDGSAKEVIQALLAEVEGQVLFVVENVEEWQPEVPRNGAYIQKQALKTWVSEVETLLVGRGALLDITHTNRKGQVFGGDGFLERARHAFALVNVDGSVLLQVRGNTHGDYPRSQTVKVRAVAEDELAAVYAATGFDEDESTIVKMVFGGFDQGYTAEALSLLEQPATAAEVLGALGIPCTHRNASRTLVRRLPELEAAGVHVTKTGRSAWTWETPQRFPYVLPAQRAAQDLDALDAADALDALDALDA